MMMKAKVSAGKHRSGAGKANVLVGSNSRYCNRRPADVVSYCHNTLHCTNLYKELHIVFSIVVRVV
jgi:hypothetical protein